MFPRVPVSHNLVPYRAPTVIEVSECLALQIILMTFVLFLGSRLIPWGTQRCVSTTTRLHCFLYHSDICPFQIWSNLILQLRFPVFAAPALWRCDLDLPTLSADSGPNPNPNSAAISFECYIYKTCADSNCLFFASTNRLATSFLSCLQLNLPVVAKFFYERGLERERERERHHSSCAFV